MRPKISVVTVTLNSESTIAATVRSIRRQLSVSHEHIIKDGGSHDGTLEIVRQENPNATVVTLSDCGIYDAMNQGFEGCTGEIISFLNSDDYFADENVFSDVVTAFESPEVEFVYGDIAIVSQSCRVIRLWRAGQLPEKGIYSTQIPHPAFFVRRDTLARIARTPFDASYRICADLKQQLLLINARKAKGAYIPRVVTIMRAGGASSSGIGSYFRGWPEAVRAWNEVHGSGGTFYALRKVLSKISSLRPLTDAPQLRPP